MNPQTIIECAAEDGLTLIASPDGKIKISGDQNKINEWIETIKENKAAILAELEGTPVQRTFNHCSASETDSKYTLIVTNADTDPVLITLGIKGLGTIDIEIPRARYDGIALLELIERHSAEAEPQREAACTTSREILHWPYKAAAIKT